MRHSNFLAFLFAPNE
ncbi:TPA: hypothetical protein ACH5JA_001556, partial [Enterococcus faecium]|nr:hypothetical protein [Enterococcus faecium]